MVLTEEQKYHIDKMPYYSKEISMKESSLSQACFGQE